MVLVHYLSIIIEIIVAVMGLRLFLNKKTFGLGIFVTFGIYVVYDLVKLSSINFNTDLLYLIFFIASVSALLTVIQLSKTKK